MKKLLFILATAFGPLFAQDLVISNAAELTAFRDEVNKSSYSNFKNKTVVLANDITLTGNWIPIGKSSLFAFCGTFDGQGHTISGLSVNNATSYAGLFGYVCPGGQLKNINVVGTEIVATAAGTDSPSKYSGGLVGYYASDKDIDNCSVTIDYVYNAYNNFGEVSEASFSGGLVGYAEQALTITNSRAYIKNTNLKVSYGNMGGLVGGGAATIINSYTTGILYGITNFKRYDIDGINYNTGGLVGRGIATIINSYSSAEIKGKGGGLVGTIFGGTITDSYASGNVSNGGGLVGEVRGTTHITNSYASGNVSNGGGLIYCDNSCTVMNGNAPSYVTNNSVYYKSEGADKAVDMGLTTGITAIPSDDLKKQATFVGWDFDNVWSIKEGISYPYLKSFPPPLFLSDFSIDNMNEEYVFTGNNIEPDPIIKLKTNGTPLIKNVDYKLSYETNWSVGTGKIAITGIGSYLTRIRDTIYFEIIPKPITIANAVAQTKIYDGTTTATITGTSSSIIQNDDVSFDIIGTFDSKDVGNYKQVIGYVTLKGTDAGNYTLSSSYINTYAEITKKPLTITLEPKIMTKSLSDPMPYLTENLVYNGLVAGETKNVITGTTIFSYTPSFTDYYPEIGEYFIMLSGTLTATNYSCSYDNWGLKLIVTQDVSSSSIETPSSSSTEIEQSSSSTEIEQSSSSTEIEQSSSSTETTPSSSSEDLTTVLSQTARANAVLAVHNAINLQVQSNAKLEIYNLNGKRQKSLNFSNGVYNITLGSLPKGMYIVKVSFGNRENRTILRVPVM